MRNTRNGGTTTGTLTGPGQDHNGADGGRSGLGLERGRSGDRARGWSGAGAETGPGAGAETGPGAGAGTGAGE